MGDADFLRALWSTPWWEYDPKNIGFWGSAYHWFNLIEGCFWVGFAVLVFTRYLRRPRLKWEPLYATTFLLFGLTDFREAYVQSAPLVIVKGILLVGLLWQRHEFLKITKHEGWF